MSCSICLLSGTFWKALDSTFSTSATLSSNPAFSSSNEATRPLSSLTTPSLSEALASPASFASCSSLRAVVSLRWKSSLSTHNLTLSSVRVTTFLHSSSIWVLCSSTWVCSFSVLAWVATRVSLSDPASPCEDCRAKSSSTLSPAPRRTSDSASCNWDIMQDLSALRSVMVFWTKAISPSFSATVVTRSAILASRVWTDWTSCSCRSMSWSLVTLRWVT